MHNKQRLFDLENKAITYRAALKEMPQRIEEARREEQRARESSMLGFREYPRFTVAGVEQQREELQLRLQTCERWIAAEKAEKRLDALEERIAVLDGEVRRVRSKLTQSPSVALAQQYESLQRQFNSAVAEAKKARPQRNYVRGVGWIEDRKLDRIGAVAKDLI